ncbi:efflux RND transporter periplasmic adaptor subunit [Parvibaculaceae bacterium PLY_AMNH_Bact1]|nr:efflux RND transporter periplasmic adaptor subunit [Parvibaculaceae bacterium PLY_AMNH_Bact1]
MKRILDPITKRFSKEAADPAYRAENVGRLQLILVVSFFLFAVLVSSLLSGTDRTPQLKDEEEFAPLVNSTIVNPETRRIEIVGSGAVSSQVDVQIIPQVQGRVDWLSAVMHPGGSFLKDEVLFRIEARDFELEVERRRAEVASARTNLQLEEAEGLAATREWEEITPSEPVPDLVARKPQIRDRRAALASAQAQLARAQLDLDRTNFSLPFNGRVVSSNVELGQFMATGQSYGTVYSLDGLEVTVPLADKDLKWLQPLNNVEAIIQTSYLGVDRVIQAKATRVSAQLDAQTRFASVIVSLGENVGTEDTLPLVPGVFVSVTFRGPELDNLVTVPTAAVQENGKIWTVVDQRLKVAQPEIVQTGPTVSLIRGLAAGTEILLSNVPGAVENMAVRTVVATTSAINTVEAR